jgi:hypothetical protein
VHLNPNYQAGKLKVPQLVNLDQSYYVSEGNKSRDNSTDAFTGLRGFGFGEGTNTATGSGFLSPTDFLSGRGGNMRNVLS